MSAASLGKHTCYPVLTVCEDDFESRWEFIEHEDKAELKVEQKLVESMTSDEWRLLSEIMADWLFDGDAYDEALNFAIGQVEKSRLEESEKSA